MNSVTGKVFGGGLTTFLILFSVGVSPLPCETPELFSTRTAYSLFAILYALCMASLFWPKPRVAHHPHFIGCTSGFITYPVVALSDTGRALDGNPLEPQGRVAIGPK